MRVLLTASVLLATTQAAAIIPSPTRTTDTNPIATIHPRDTSTDTAATSTYSLDPLSAVSVIAGVAMPGIVGIVFTISSWAAAANPCVNQCLNQVPAVDPNSPSSVQALCSNTQLLSTCSTSCPGNPLIASLVKACNTTQVGALSSGPQPVASGSAMRTWFVTDALMYLVEVIVGYEQR